MKRLFIISLLFLSIGLSQHLTEIIETYENGNIKSITSHKETRNRIEKVKYKEYHENGQKSGEAKFKDDKREFLKQWNEDGSVKK